MEGVIPLRKKSMDNKEPKIWVVGSGKGGVGKSFVTSSIALTLTKLDYSVTIIDFDLSGANIHTTLGLNPSSLSIRGYFEGQKKISELIIPTPFPRLGYIQGLWDSWMPLEYNLEQVKTFTQDIKSIKSDFILIDLGAGALTSHLELFQSADEKILVTTPEPTSVEKTYRFIESLICYSFKDKSDPAAFHNLTQALQKCRMKMLDKPFSIKNYVQENSALLKSDFFSKHLQSPLRIIVNGCRSHSQVDLGHSIKSVCNKYYDLSLDYAGQIDFDNAVWQSVRNKEPVLIAQPFTPLAGQFLTACKHIIDHQELRAVV